MTLLVTGGAGFIGSNVVLGRLVAGDEPLGELDAALRDERRPRESQALRLAPVEWPDAD